MTDEELAQVSQAIDEHLAISKHIYDRVVGPYMDAARLFCEGAQPFLEVFAAGLKLLSASLGTYLAAPETQQLLARIERDRRREGRRHYRRRYHQRPPKAI